MSFVNLESHPVCHVVCTNVLKEAKDEGEGPDWEI